MFKELFNSEDRGVSPVIGVILMVAITVILAAVIGAFVLGLGDQVSNNAPQASFEFDFEDDKNATITHGGGDDIENDAVTVTVMGEDMFNSSGAAGSSRFQNTGWGTAGTISTGDELEIVSTSTSGNDFSGQTLRIIWNNPSGGSSNTIGERDWPN